MTTIEPKCPTGLTILSIATEWDSGHGGISTFNRELCRSLAQLGHKVYCGLLAFTDEEYRSAAAANVTLVCPPKTLGIGADGHSALFRRFGSLDQNVDVVIGHARITGPYALAQKGDFYRDAKYIHFVHMDPTAIEPHKNHPERRGTETASERRDLEISLGRKAALVAAVGPELYATYSTYLQSYGDAPPVHHFLPGLFPSTWNATPPLRPNCLLFGRAEDTDLKGVTLAATAMGIVCDGLPWSQRVRLVVLGARSGEGDDLRAKLKESARNCEVVIEPYTSDRAKVMAAVRQASLVLMPSRAEGFGLSGLEAISECVPVLLSNRSGLWQALDSILPEFAGQVSIDMTRGAQELAERVKNVLVGKELAFDLARTLRKRMESDFDWIRAARELVGALEFGSPSKVQLLGNPSAATATTSDTDILGAMRYMTERASSGLLNWRQTLRANEIWLVRSELGQVLNFLSESETKTLVLLGPPGSGKSALLARLATELSRKGTIVLAIKADGLRNDTDSPEKMGKELGLTGTVTTVVRAAAQLSQTVLIVDQLDALGDLVDIRTDRLSVLLDTVAQVAAIEGAHVVMSCRSFDFHHDIRFQRLDAQTLTLELPSMLEVEGALGSAHLAVSQFAPHVRELLRNPQCLDVFLELFSNGSSVSAFESYQVMLDALWHQRLSHLPDSEELQSALGGLALLMGVQEELWIALSQATQEQPLARLETLIRLGFLVQNDGRVAFAHQTFYEFARAKAFLRKEASLVEYTLVHQGSLFVRPTLWTSLAYLRKLDPNVYIRDIESLWSEPSLRPHVQSLLIEFLGGVDDPSEREVALVVPMLSHSEWRTVTIEAVTGSRAWYERMRGRDLPVLLRDAHAGEMVLFLAKATDFAVTDVASLMAHHWKGTAEKCRLIAFVLNSATKWDESLGELAIFIAAKGEIDVSLLSGVVSSAVTLLPKFAPKIVRAHLDKRLDGVPTPDDRTAGEFATVWEAAIHRIEVRRPYDDLLRDGGGLHALSEVATAAPHEFVECIWPWFVRIVRLLVDDHQPSCGYRQDYALGTSSGAHDIGYEVAYAVNLALSELAVTAPAAVEALVQEWQREDTMAVHCSLIKALEANLPALASCAFKYLTEDPRRLLVGGSQEVDGDTVGLVAKLAPLVTADQLNVLESQVLASSCMDEVSPDISPESVSWRREENTRHRLRLLQAMGTERLSIDAGAVLEKDTSRYPAVDAEEVHFARSIQAIGSPMSAEQMLHENDEVVLKLFDELPDSTGCGHPTRPMEGGSIQASDALAHAAKADPERFALLIQRFQVGQGERPVVRVIEALAEVLPFERIEAVVLEFSSRGFFVGDFRQDIARTLERAARDGARFSEAICALLVSWLDDKDDELVVMPVVSNRRRTESILFGIGGGGVLPGGNFPILMALTTAYLGAKTPDLEKWFAIIDGHLERSENGVVWEHMLRYFEYSYHLLPDRTSMALDRLFDRFAEVRDCPRGAAIIARAMHYTPAETIERWAVDLWNGKWDRREQAFGELLVLAATSQNPGAWAKQRLEVELSAFDNGQHKSEALTIGVAHALSHLWGIPDRRQSCTDALVRLIPNSDDELAQPIMHCLSFADGFLWDDPTRRLLTKITEHRRILVSTNRAKFVENLKTLLPVGSELVCNVVDALVGGSSSTKGDHGYFHDGPELVDIAITLQRLGDPWRERGLRVFEELLRVNAYGARDMLAEIDPLSRRGGIARRPVRRRATSRRRLDA